VTSRDSDVNVTSHHFATAGWENYLQYFLHPDGKGVEVKHLDGGCLSLQVNRGCDPFDCQEWENVEGFVAWMAIGML